MVSKYQAGKKETSKGNSLSKFLLFLVYIPYLVVPEIEIIWTVICTVAFFVDYTITLSFLFLPSHLLLFHSSEPCNIEVILGLEKQKSVVNIVMYLELVIKVLR